MEGSGGTHSLLLGETRALFAYAKQNKKGWISGNKTVNKFSFGILVYNLKIYYKMRGCYDVDTKRCSLGVALMDQTESCRIIIRRKSK